MRFENNGQEIVLNEFPTITGQYRVIDYNRLPARGWVFVSFEDAKRLFLRQVSYSLKIYLEEFSHE